MIKYRDYQKTGIRFLMQRSGAILGDDMGSGKTLQSLSAALFLYDKGLVDKILIVCPTSLVINWQAECAKFFNLETYAHFGEKRKTERFMEESLIITTYQTLAIDCDKQVFPCKLTKAGYIYEVNISNRLCVIVDEAHNVKNRTTNISQCLYSLKAKYYWLLTGTPMHNKPEDIYGLLKIADNDLMSADEWAELFYKYENVVDKRGNTVYYFNQKLKKKVPAQRVAGYKNLEILSSILNKYMLRREKREILPHLPKHHVYEIYYSPDLDLESKIDLLTERHKDKIALVGKVFELLQGVYEGKFIPNSKSELLKDMIEGTDDRVVVWTTHRESTKGLAKYLKSLKRPILTHTGEMTTRERDKAIKSWQKEERSIMLMTIKSGGVGLNLVEGATQFFYGMSYNASDNDQAEARLHRPGQENEVSTYYLIGSGSLEQSLYNLVRNKRQYAKALYSGQGIEALYKIILKL